MREYIIREEVIKGFTIWTAYGAFQKDVLRSIEVGKLLAEFIILDQDILEVEPKEFLTAKRFIQSSLEKLSMRAMNEKDKIIISN